MLVDVPIKREREGADPPADVMRVDLSWDAPCKSNRALAIAGVFGSEYMEVQFTKGNDRDFIEARRVDGTLEKTTFPKKGWFPHDAVHLIVERRLRFQHGFWGRIARGATPDEIAAIAKAGGHASSARAVRPADEIIELLHAERLVECFEAEMWSKCSDNATFRSILDAACSQSKILSPQLLDEEIGDIRTELKDTMDAWRELAVGESLTLRMSW